MTARRGIARRLADLEQIAINVPPPPDDLQQRVQAMTDAQLHAALCACHARDLRLQLEVAQVPPHPAVVALLMRLDAGAASDDDLALLIDPETMFGGPWPDLATVTARFAAALH